jgi:hypothetical protein
MDNNLDDGPGINTGKQVRGHNSIGCYPKPIKVVCWQIRERDKLTGCSRNPIGIRENFKKTGG